MGEHRAPLTAAAFHELHAVLGRLEERFTTGPGELDDPTAVVEGYRWILSILSVGAEVWLWGDAQRPRFVDIVGPNRKWGGDNADAFYQYAPIDARRTYRVTGDIGDAVYWSLTVYGGPDDGRYSTHIVGSLNDRTVPVAADGTFQFHISPTPQDGPTIRLEADAVAAVTRDYLVHPKTDRRMTWAIECLDGDGAPVPTDEDTARRFRCVTTWLEEQAAMVPVRPPVTNGVAEPYPVPAQTFGWAAGDAAYAMGGYDLGPDEALIIRGRSPECVFWNLCLWNGYLHTYNYDYDDVTINGGQVQHEDDGSWTIVVSERDPGRPNWVRTQGHPSGLLWFRWFLPEVTPDQPTCEVVTLP